MKNLVKRLMIHAAIIGGAYAATCMDMTDVVNLHAPAVPMQNVFQEEKAVGGYTHEEIQHHAHLATVSYTGKDETETGKAYIQQMKSDGWQVHEFRTKAERSGLIFCRGDEVTISYHGTESLRNWATDFYATKTDITWAPGSSHTGFLNGFEKTWDQVYSTIHAHATNRCMPVSGLKITVTGHSLGGALAALATYRLQQVSDVKDLHMITYAAPRVFDQTAAANFSVKRALRVVKRNGDPVPHVGPAFMGFKHTGDLFELAADEAKVPHLMDGYHHAIPKIDMDEADITGKKSGGILSYFYKSETDREIEKGITKRRNIGGWVEAGKMSDEERRSFVQFHQAKYEFARGHALQKSTSEMSELRNKVNKMASKLSLYKDEMFYTGALKSAFNDKKHAEKELKVAVKAVNVQQQRLMEVVGVGASEDTIKEAEVKLNKLKAKRDQKDADLVKISSAFEAARLAAAK